MQDNVTAFIVVCLQALRWNSCVRCGREARVCSLIAATSMFIFVDVFSDFPNVGLSYIC